MQISNVGKPKHSNPNQILKHEFSVVTLLKYSQIHKDLLCFVPRTPKNSPVTKFYDLKGSIFCVFFGEAEFIRLTPMNDNEPKVA